MWAGLIGSIGNLGITNQRPQEFGALDKPPHSARKLTIPIAAAGVLGEVLNKIRALVKDSAKMRDRDTLGGHNTTPGVPNLDAFYTQIWVLSRVVITQIWGYTRRGNCAMEYRMSLAAVGVYLQERRQAKKISQRDLADRVGTSLSQIERIEAGAIDTRISLLFKIAREVDASTLKIARLLLNDPELTEEEQQLMDRLARLRGPRREAAKVILQDLLDAEERE